MGEKESGQWSVVSGQENQWPVVSDCGSLTTDHRPPTTVLIPSSFWKFGWHRALSVEAMHLYFAGEAERQTSPFAPWWRLTRDVIAARYGFQKQIVNRAQRELKRAGLLEVLFETGAAPAGRYARQMNYFRQNPFYDRARRARELKRAARGYRPAVAKAARELLALVEENSDPQKLAALCEAVSVAGVARARRAAAVVRRLAANSTRRRFEYVVELVVSGQWSVVSGQWLVVSGW